MKPKEISKFLSGFFAGGVFSLHILGQAGKFPMLLIDVELDWNVYWGAFILSLVLCLVFGYIGWFKKK